MAEAAHPCPPIPPLLPLISYLAERIWPRLHTAMGLKKLQPEEEQSGFGGYGGSSSYATKAKTIAAADDGEEESWATTGEQVPD